MQPRHRVVLVLALAASSAARADEIPIVTLTDAGPNQDIPTHRSFYVAGDAASTIENAQAIVVRKGSPSMFGDDGPDCHAVLANLKLDVSSSASADDDEEESEEAESPVVPPRFVAGRHFVFEMFPHAAPELREADVLVSAAWQRSSVDARQYRVLVPHDPDFFSAGHAYCLFVITTERGQEIADSTLVQLVDGVARKFVRCGDKSSCDDDALAEYQGHVEKELAASRSVASSAPGELKAIAAIVKEAARAELASATGIIEARDHLEDRWNGEINVMTPLARVVWAETASDPFARAVATMLARSAALIPQVHPQRGGSSVALYTTDGRLQVKAIQILDDGRSIRVASSKAPTGDQARVVTATTDTLAVADGITLYDLIQLGHGRIHVDKDWITLGALGERLSGLGLETWSADDAAYLSAASAQMKRLADFVDGVTSGVSCNAKAIESNEAEQSADAVHRHLGEWMVCQHVDAGALETLTQQLDELVHEDQAWKATKDKLVARSRRIVTLTTTAPISMRVGFEASTWAFSYVTPVLGYAGIIRPDESFGLFYFGAQVHLDPNPIDDVLWRDGVTTKDLRRAVALELALAPYGSSFGPQRRYSGLGGIPPLFAGIAVHIVPYTSITFGGTLLDRKLSTLPQEQPRAIFAPYVGFTLQLNIPDLLRRAARPSSDTTATR